MWKPLRSRLVRYLLPFGAMMGALLAQAAVARVVPKGVDFPYAFFYLIAVFGVAWFGGYGPGAIVSLLTMVGLPYAAAHSFRLTSIDPSRLILLLGVSLLVSKVSRGQQRVREVLSDANEELDKRVQSRTQDLAQAVEGLESEIVRRTKSEEKLQTQLGRLNLLDQITRAIGERQDLNSIFQVVVRTLEDSLPIDFGCICLYNPDTEALTVTCVGVHSEALAMELAMTEHAQIVADQNGLARCVDGHLVYEPNVGQLDFPFPNRLSRGGLGSVVAAPLRSESNIFGILVAARRQPEGFSSGECEFLRQLSEHVALAAHQAQMYGALQQAYDDLRRSQQAIMEQERLRVLGQMASGIAHDINNALSPVALYTESLLEREANVSPRVRAYLETTQRAIDDVAHTVGRMREFYRQREPELILMPVDLNVLVSQVLDLTRARWSDMPQQRGIVIQVCTVLEPCLPAVAGIESEIREALTNLIFNAVDAMKDGGTLTLRTKSTGEVMPASPPRRVRVQVEDTGVGMDEETRRRCLEPFFTTKGERGTGLGLGMVFGVAKRQNAELEVESVPGTGTIMGLNFPAAPTGVQPSQIVHAHVPPSPLHILIVDDDPLIIRSLRAILEDDGHAVTTAAGGQEGIDVLSAAAERDERFAAVITDLGMPYVDGRKVAGAVKMTCRDTPVIMLTGWGQRLVAEEDMPENVDCVLNKPPKLFQLRAALAELVPGSRRNKVL
jgi:signal transduction histidine kinase/CheY-like chemotaxis protein